MTEKLLVDRHTPSTRLQSASTEVRRVLRSARNVKIVFHTRKAIGGQIIQVDQALDGKITLLLHQAWTGSQHTPIPDDGEVLVDPDLPEFSYSAVHFFPEEVKWLYESVTHPSAMIFQDDIDGHRWHQSLVQAADDCWDLPNMGHRPYDAHIKNPELRPHEYWGFYSHEAAKASVSTAIWEDRNGRTHLVHEVSKTTPFSARHDFVRVGPLVKCVEAAKRRDWGGDLREILQNQSYENLEDFKGLPVIHLTDGYRKENDMSHITDATIQARQNHIQSVRNKMISDEVTSLVKKADQHFAERPGCKRMDVQVPSLDKELLTQVLEQLTNSGLFNILGKYGLSIFVNKADLIEYNQDEQLVQESRGKRKQAAWKLFWVGTHCVAYFLDKIADMALSLM